MVFKSCRFAAFAPLVAALALALAGCGGSDGAGGSGDTGGGGQDTAGSQDTGYQACLTRCTEQTIECHKVLTRCDNLGQCESMDYWTGNCSGKQCNSSDFDKLSHACDGSGANCQTSCNTDSSTHWADWPS